MANSITNSRFEPNCEEQPYGVLSQYAPCDEIPTCGHIYCYEDVKCLLAETTAPILTGCQSATGKDLYCVCPLSRSEVAPPVLEAALKHFLSMAVDTNYTRTDLAKQELLTSNRLNAAIGNFSDAPAAEPTVATTLITSTVEAVTEHSGGLGGGAIAGIVIGVLVLLALIAIGIFIGMRYMKDKRKNHGEYRPQWEEEHHAKDLPHIPPPNIEGLI